jgi:predicted acylesterase/phospholipase RssA/CRP-like cAMP-binding protein
MTGDSPDGPSFGSIPLFQGLPEAVLDDLVRTARPVRLEEGRTLFRQGDPGAAMYVLTAGRLEVRVTDGRRESAVDRLMPPAPLGETALLTGRPRSATIVALERSRLVELPAREVDAAVRKHPELLARLEEAIRPRLRRTQLAPLLIDWFGARDADTVRALQKELGWIEVASGTTLFDQGDPADAAYLVVSGRLRLERDGETGPEVAGEVAPGESTGETSLLTGSARTATVRALRDTRLVRVTSDVAGRHPGFAMRLARVVAERAVRAQQGRGRGRRPRTFALIPVTADAPLREVADALVAAAPDPQRVGRLDREALARAFDLPDVADARPGELADSVLSDWLDRQERDRDQLLYLADAEATPWTRRAIRQADRVVLVASSGGLHRLTRIAEAARELAPHTPQELLLVRPDDVERPRGTAAWLDTVRPAAHHHVRLADAGEVRRAARRMAGTGRTLVLSGGGARGYVHIGLLGALEEAGIEIDAVAGTSMGALVGGGYALARTYEFASASARRFGDPATIVDRTLPVVSIARSRGVTRLLRDMFGEVRIEDLTTPYFCVSANLSRARPYLHERGELWRAIRASSAIPGVFTPILEGGDLLVDGGVMNNFPVDLARARFGDGPLIASNAYGRERERGEYAFDDEVSGWRVLAERLRPRSWRRIKAPSILTTLTQATSLNSHYLMESIGRGADLLVRYPTDGVRSLEFERVEELLQMGWTHGRAAVEGWRPEAIERA